MKLFPKASEGVSSDKAILIDFAINLLIDLLCPSANRITTTKQYSAGDVNASAAGDVGVSAAHSIDAYAVHVITIN